MVVQRITRCGVEAEGREGRREDRELAGLCAALRRNGSAFVYGLSLDLHCSGPEFRRVNDAGQGGNIRRGVE